MGKRALQEFRVRIDRKVVQCTDVTVKATSARAARARAMALINGAALTEEGEYAGDWEDTDVIAKPKIGQVM
jgi:hypothetical protein